ETRFDGLPAGTRAVGLPDNSFNSANYFLTVFGRPESSSACECERSLDASLSQSLHLLNSKDIQAKVSADSGRAAGLATAAHLDDPARLKELYLLAYGRPPRTAEIDFAREYLARKVAPARGGKDPAQVAAAEAKARREAYEDMVWALLNTKEFLFNH
ncbi:MAG: DUF1553 domain-containing protein, partial [Verrucomicrobiota bacterium]